MSGDMNEAWSMAEAMPQVGRDLPLHQEITRYLCMHEADYAIEHR